MDPSFSIDLTTIAGIVALTITIVHGLKGWLASVPLLEKLPVAAYVVLVSIVLTLLSRDVFHLIGGDRGELLMQAIIQALAASGAVEWWRAGVKPLEQSGRAQDATMRRGSRDLYVLPILLAVGLSAGCASTGKVLVETERAMHATIAGADDAINAACDARLRSEDDCKAFNGSIAAAWSAYEVYNKAAQEGSIAGVPAMLDALEQLSAAVTSARPQATAVLDDLMRLYNTIKALLPKEKTDAAHPQS